MPRARRAAVHHDDEATTAVFPSGPEGEFFNHAVLRRGVPVVSLQATPMAERVYAACGFRTVARIVEHVPGGRCQDTKQRGRTA